MDDDIESYISNSLSSITQQIASSMKSVQPILRQLDDVIKPASIMAENLRLINFSLVPSIELSRIDAILTPIGETMDIIRRISQEITPILSPFYDWLNSFDFTSCLVRGSEQAILFREVNEFYMQSMYKAKWFPHVGWHTDISLFNDILDILYSSKGISKRAVNRIDRVVIQYYTDKEIRQIQKRWRNSNVNSTEKRIMNQAINAYFRSEYAITSICLSTLWQNLIYNKIGDLTSGRKDKQTKEYYAKLIDENGYSEAFKSFFDEFIMYDCRSKEQAIPDVPGRNSNAHGWYLCYPKKKAALNAIFLTDFILDLKEKTIDGV